MEILRFTRTLITSAGAVVGAAFSLCAKHPLLGTFAVSSVLLARHFGTSPRCLISLALDATAIRFPGYLQYKETFISSILPARPNIDIHSHPISAGDRSSAKLFADSYCDWLGIKPFIVQKSSKDQRQGYDGDRHYYWAKDTQARAEICQPNPSDLLFLVDVDFYMDMNLQLLKHPQPTLLYTLIPEAVAHPGPEVSFTFDRDNYLHQYGTSGTHYVHQLWNYKNDIIQVHSSSFFDYLFHRPTAVTYSVQLRRIAIHRYVVCLIPITTWNGVFGFMSWALSSNNLQRLVVADGDFLRLDVVRNFGNHSHMRSTGRVGEYHCATIPVATDTALAALSRLNKSTLSSAQVATYLGDPTERMTGDTKMAIVALLEYHRRGAQNQPDQVYPIELSVNRYQFNPSKYDPSAKASVQPFMNPISLNCFAPDSTPSNDAVIVNDRIAAVKSAAQPTPYMLECMDEFLGQVFPIAHALVPADQDQVYEKQDSPTQRHILDDASVMPWAKRCLSVFMKKESYSEIKAPRAISQINGVDKLDYSAFMYSLATYLKTFPWYAFGNSPRDISLRVADICAGAERFVDTSDLSRYDGRVSPALRLLERKALLLAFNTVYRDQIIDLHESQFNLVATTTNGIMYDSGTARASGSPETSVLNTLTNAFISYYAMRLKDETDGECYPADAAFANLGIYGGDDALTADISPKNLARAARAVGQLVKSNVILRGGIGVEFLARQYGPFIWRSDPNSCCDLPRQLAKFHTTVIINNFSSREKLIQKCLAFYLTDHDTPFLGQFCIKVLTLAGVDLDTVDPTTLDKRIASYFSRYDLDVQFPNQDTNGWMVEYVQRVLPDFDLEAATAWVAKLETIEQCLAPPLFVVAKPQAPPPHDVVINGVITLADGKEEEIVIPAITTPVAPAPRVDTLETPAYPKQQRRDRSHNNKPLASNKNKGKNTNQNKGNRRGNKINSDKRPPPK